MRTSRTLVHEDSVNIDVPLDRVRQAITTLDGIRGWWSPIVTGSLAPGRTFQVGFAGLDETITLSVVQAQARGTDWLVREHSSAPDWADSRIAFRLEPRSAGCRLVVRHTGVEPHQVAAGWEHFLDSIRSLVETGAGLPYPWPDSDPLRVAMRYHDAWTGGRFDDAIALLVDDLQTEVPINAYASRTEWAQALVGFASIVDRADLVAALGNADEAVLIYDMHTRPYGVLRIAEHFTVADGQIARIRHVHDTVALRESAASSAAR